MLESVQGMTTTSGGNLLVLLASVLPTMRAQRDSGWRHRRHFEVSTPTHSSIHASTRFPSSINELLLARPVRFGVLGRPLRSGLTRVELRDDLRVDAIELLLGEDAQERPCQVERVEDAPGFVGTCVSCVSWRYGM